MTVINSADRAQAILNRAFDAEHVTSMVLPRIKSPSEVLTDSRLHMAENIFRKLADDIKARREEADTQEAA